MWTLRGLLVLIGEFVACMCECVRPLSMLCAELWTGLAALLSLLVLGWSLSLSVTGSCWQHKCASHSSSV
jgi:hypothetical protein